MADHSAAQAAAERDARNVVTLDLSDEKRMKQLSSSGKVAQDRRKEAAVGRANNKKASGQANTRDIGHSGGSRSGRCSNQGECLSWRRVLTLQFFGYDKLAVLIVSDASLSCFRRFAKLNSKNLLYYQAELVNLQEELTEIVKKDKGSEDPQKKDYPSSVWNPKDSVNRERYVPPSGHSSWRCVSS
ncbi:hypothetical protein BBP40_005649 [Aspergillus hancockii]|nr:hypothetical protein BBP40_005649 [Aspergillus hancockii]